MADTASADGIYIEHWRQGVTLDTGFYIEGLVPYVPEDGAPGWVSFDLERATVSDLAQKLFCDLGVDAETVIYLTRGFTDG